MKKLRNWCVIAGTAFLLSGCIDPNEERGLCTYLGTCEMGLETYMDFDYCKELGSCDDGKDPTEYTASGKPSVKSSRDKDKDEDKEEKEEKVQTRKHEDED